MEERPYLCPHCNSNRTKFRVIQRSAQEIKKDAFEGNVLSMGEVEPFTSIQGDREVQCLVCNHIAYENMFIKSAERSPRVKQEVRGRGE